MTARQVFDRVPPVNETLNGCKYRDFEREALVQVTDGHVCSQLFQVTRCLMRRFACYRFSLRATREYSFHAVVNSLYEPRELYSLTIDSLSERHIIYPVMHFNDVPREDRVFNQEEFTHTYTLHHVFSDEYEL